MTNDLRFLMIGAMYENGGNVTHRFLDGHPELFVYPFESQVGTHFVQDRLSSMFPAKYRWPEFRLDANPYQDYKAIIDEEGKIRSRTPFVSKFRESPMEFSDDERCEIYQSIVAKTGRSRANNVAAFFQATFEAWKDYARFGREAVYVGYSPIIVVDAEKILQDMPNAHFLHVVRNPWSAYADTKKRPVPLSLRDYMLGWCTNQYFALMLREKYPARLHIVRTEDTVANPKATLGAICDAIGVETGDTLTKLSWNGKELQEAYPWGTLRKATPEMNLATAKELSSEEASEIRDLTWQYQDVLDYRSFLKS